ncbi:unnamed protein product, partial [Polarella glacialis]
KCSACGRLGALAARTWGLSVLKQLEKAGRQLPRWLKEARQARSSVGRSLRSPAKRLRSKAPLALLDSRAFSTPPKVRAFLSPPARKVRRAASPALGKAPASPALPAEHEDPASALRLLSPSPAASDAAARLRTLGLRRFPSSWLPFAQEEGVALLGGGPLEES